MIRNILSAGLVLLAATAGLRAQTPTLTVTPALITNDYTGPITLTIGNLAPGAKVLAAKYPDLNGNGIIDAGEPMMQGWGVMDGNQSFIGGVRNRNVPGDEDGSANGQIQMVLNYPGDNEVLDHIAGQYLFQVSDPQGSFAPVTAPFTIVQKAWPQWVSGTARNADSGTPLANAMVIMISPQSNGGVGTFTDANGNYAVSNAPGSYALLATRPGLVSDQSAAMIALAGNSSVSTNLTARAGTLYVAGQVTDQSNGKPLFGLFVECESTNNLISLAFTDTNGNYSLAVSPSQWKIKIKPDSGLTSKGYVQTGNGQRVDIDATSVSNLNFSFPKATALIYGQVLDNASNGLANLPVDAQDSTWTESSAAQSRTNGYYCLGVLNGVWTAQLDNDSLASLGLMGQPANPVTLNAGQATNINLRVVRPSTHLIGRAVDNFGTPLGNMSLVAFLVNTNGPSSQNLNGQTAADGTFNLAVSGGQWSLALECNQSFQQGLVSPQLQFTVVDGVDQTNITLTAQHATATITVHITDSLGNPVSESAWASYSPSGGYNSGCGTQSGNTVQLSVFNGTWIVGLEGDVAAQGYDDPAQQTVVVNGNNPTVNFTLYPAGQTPARLNATVMNGQLQLFLSGSSGQRYRIDTTTNLNSPSSWVPLTTNTAGGGGFWYSEPANSKQPRFYRSVRVP